MDKDYYRMTLIQVKAVQQYGNWRYYPANTLAELIVKSSDKSRQTVNKGVLDMWKKAGYSVEILPDMPV